MTESRTRLAVLASGGGSNLQAILDHFDALGPDAPAVPALVVSDRLTSGALERARRHEVPAQWLPKDRNADLLALLERHRITHIALAGYLRLVPAEVVRAFHGRLLNVHPALLPAFGGPGMYGHHVHEAVLRAGARVSGPTVHFVSEQYDEGAIIAQWPVPVRNDDSAETLAARVLAAEHWLYPRCVTLVCAGETRLGPENVVEGAPSFAFHRFVPDGTPDPFTDHAPSA